MTNYSRGDRLTHGMGTRYSAKRLVRFGLGLAAAGAVLGAAVAPGVFAQTQAAPVVAVQTLTQTQPVEMLPLTVSQIDAADLQPLTVAETEGPYFKTNSPERTSLVEDGMQGTLLTITGQVLTQDGTPLANALVDFWQADAGGAYDNAGYNLRGHQYTDANGNYTLTTVIPGLYPGRTRHIHVKVQAPNGPLLTTQLYFPGEARNATDGIFNPSLVLNIQANGDGTQSALFNFVVATA
jgi:protocatechuate 3,4-dioxygenase beta subunit